MKKAFNFILNLLFPDNEVDKIILSNNNLNVEISRELLVHVDNEVIVIKSLPKTFPMADSFILSDLKKKKKKI